MIVKIVFAASLTLVSLSCISESRYGSTRPTTLKIQSCDFRFSDFFHGTVTQPGSENDFRSAGYSAKITISRSEQSFGFNFTCHSDFNDKNEIAMQFAGRLNPDAKQWVSDFGDASSEDISHLIPATKTFPLSSKNGTGFYTIQDDLDGEPTRRMRHISYCLFHEAKAICGDGEVMRLADVKSDMLSYALQILRSVEFKDRPATTKNRASP